MFKIFLTAASDRPLIFQSSQHLRTLHTHFENSTNIEKISGKISKWYHYVVVLHKKQILFDVKPRFLTSSESLWQAINWLYLSFAIKKEGVFSFLLWGLILSTFFSLCWHSTQPLMRLLCFEAMFGINLASSLWH